MTGPYTDDDRFWEQAALYETCPLCLAVGSHVETCPTMVVNDTPLKGLAWRFRYCAESARRLRSFFYC